MGVQLLGTVLRCGYFDAGACRSCTLLGTPYEDQLHAKQQLCEESLAEVGARPQWLPPATGPASQFRNKAKLVVGGKAGHVTLGILDGERHGVDLRECGLHEPVIHDAIPILAGFCQHLRLEPYDVNGRRGELKYVIVTASSEGRLMVRFVLRSTKHLDRIRRHLGELRLALPPLAVASVNLHPEHKAVLEGDTELVLTERATLSMPLGDVTLQLHPRAFFQTNTPVARQLYAQARDWVDQLAPSSVWDLYCGVGGFAAHLRSPGRHVSAVELSAEAVESARQTESLAGVELVCADAAEFAGSHPPPDLLVVNPPRRGLSDLAPLLEERGPAHVLYSSCHPESLARDLAAMPSYDAVRARVFDMFPQTHHLEVLTLLQRRP